MFNINIIFHFSILFYDTYFFIFLPWPKLKVLPIYDNNLKGQKDNS